MGFLLIQVEHYVMNVRPFKNFDIMHIKGAMAKQIESDMEYVE